MFLTKDELTKFAYLSLKLGISWTEFNTMAPETVNSLLDILEEWANNSFRGPQPPSR